MDTPYREEILRLFSESPYESTIKKLERGRLLFYVTFNGGRGYLDSEVFMQDIIAYVQ